MMHPLVMALARNAMTIFLVVCGLVFVLVSGTLPAPRFDPLGAGAFPAVLGWLIILLGLADLSKPLWSRGAADPAGDDEPIDPVGLAKAAAVLGLTIVYGLSMAVFELRFAIATTLYLMAASFVLARPGWRRALLLLAVFAAFALGVDYLLKSVVYVDLP